MEEKKNNKIGQIIIIIIFLVIGCLGGFYIGKNYSSTKIIDNKEDSKKDNNMSNEQEEELDISSKLVQFLYNEVSKNVENETWSFGWRFNYKKTGEIENDFIVSERSEEDKMVLVGQNLKKTGDVVLIDNMPENAKAGYKPSSIGYFYTREYVENLYKTLYGENESIDTSIIIPLDLYGGEKLGYDSTTDKYYIYLTETGGTSGPGGYKAKLEKAIKNNDKIVLYQNIEKIYYKADENGVVTDSPENQQIENFQYIYTFEKDSDGMYKFISREKK